MFPLESLSTCADGRSCYCLDKCASSSLKLYFSGIIDVSLSAYKVVGRDSSAGISSITPYRILEQSKMTPQWFAKAQGCPCRKSILWASTTPAPSALSPVILLLMWLFFSTLLPFSLLPLPDNHKLRCGKSTHSCIQRQRDRDREQKCTLLLSIQATEDRKPEAVL